MVDDGGGVISSWKDRKAQLAITAVTTARPTYSSTSFNNTYPGMTFDGATDCLVTTTLTNFPTSSTAGFIAMLFKQVTDQTGTMFSYGGTAAGTLRRITRNSATPGRLTVSDAEQTLTDTSVSIASPNYFIGIGTWSGTTETGRINGAATSPGSKSLDTSLNTSTTRARMGANTAATAASFQNIIVAATMIGTTTDSTTLQKIEGYLAWNYGVVFILPDTHPYKMAPP